MQPGADGQVRLIGDWLKLHFTRNSGMAFGIELPPNNNLLLFMIRLMVLLGMAIFTLFPGRERLSSLSFLGMVLIIGGAFSNLMDCTFYGVLLDNAPQNAQYAWLSGQVIDMIYLDIWSGIVPQHIPVLGGIYLSIFPVFNLADAFILTGVLLVFLPARSVTR